MNKDWVNRFNERKKKTPPTLTCKGTYDFPNIIIPEGLGYYWNKERIKRLLRAVPPVIVNLIDTVKVTEEVTQLFLQPGVRGGRKTTVLIEIRASDREPAFYHEVGHAIGISKFKGYKEIKEAIQESNLTEYQSIAEGFGDAYAYFITGTTPGEREWMEEGVREVAPVMDKYVPICD